MAFSASKFFNKTEDYNKVRTVAGACLITFSSGLQWNWGNLSPYVFSYILKHHPESNSVASPWLLSFFLVAMNISFLVSGVLSKYTGRRVTTVIGITIFNAGMLSSYFIIQSHPDLLNLTLGVTVGIGCGVLTNMGMLFTLEWASKDVGFLTSLYLSAVNVGSILINELMTIYINPSNMRADIIQDGFVYFSHSDIVERVPDIFLLIGLISLVSQLIGLSLVRLKDKDLSEKLLFGDGEKAEMFRSGNGERTYGCKSPTTSAYVNCECKLSRNCPLQMSCCNPSCHPDPIHTSDSSLSKQILTSKTFYVLCFCFILVEYPYILLANYYKAFGILKINDDHFLAEMGSVMILVSAISRVIYGRLMDKFGVKDNMICISAILSVGCTFYFFSIYINKWLYATMTICLAAISCAQYNSFIVATVTIFGVDNASFNVGMLLTAGIVLHVVAPIGIKYVFWFLGWFSLFAGGSIVTLLEMILVMAFLPRI